MEFIPLEIKGAWLVKSPIWQDDRGTFREWFRSEELWNQTKIDFDVQQCNLSQSKRGVIRGIHYSLAAAGQAKWVTCVAGFTKDIIVDIRPESPTFGKYVAINLQGNSGDSVFISSSLGHGFISMEENSTIAYLVSSQYSPGEEFSINPLDPVLGLEWGVSDSELLLSVKDRAAPTLLERKANGLLPGYNLNT